MESLYPFDIGKISGTMDHSKKALSTTTVAMTTKWEDPSKLADFYSEWNDYDEQYESGYNGPRQCADVVERFFSGDKETAKVLDVAAGTGLVGEQLKMKGFKTMEALEPSEGMVRQALEKGIYQQVYLEYFNDNVRCLPDDYYDILVMVGALGEGHFPVNGLPEMVRCVKPGGLVVILGRNIFLSSLEEYRDKLEPAMEKLEEEGRWVRLEKSTIPRFFFDNEGVIFVYKVTKN